jgi:hypothetical protein
LQLEPKRIAHRRTKEELAKDAAEQAEFDMRVANLVTKDFPVRTSPPPRLTALLPPPPSPSTSAPAHTFSTALPQEAAMGTLSDWLRSLTDDQSEPQPERASSHAPEPPAPPSPVDNPMESVENVEAEINVEVVVEQPLAHVTLENITVLDDVPPEQVGAPTTDAEREELSRAKEEAWPTTRPED